MKNANAVVVVEVCNCETVVGLRCDAGNAGEYCM